MVLQLPLAFLGNIFLLFSLRFLLSVLCFHYHHIICWHDTEPRCLEQTVLNVFYNCLFSVGLPVSGNPICFDLLAHIVKDSCFYLPILHQNDPLKSEQIFLFHS